MARTGSGMLQGKVALVTGGASGIGEAVVRRMAAEGANVVFTDLNVDAGRLLEQALGASCLFVSGDHTDACSNDDAVAAAEDRFGRLDILHNNAGTMVQGDIARVEQADLEHILRVNLLGPFLMVKSALPALRRRSSAPGRSIVMTASVQSLIARPGFTAYGATKHGLAGLVGSLALELAREGIRVNAVCPGPVDTPLFKSGTAHIQPQDMAEKFIAAVPMGRLIRTDEVANAVVFLASDQASAITGAMLPVDCGISAR